LDLRVIVSRPRIDQPEAAQDRRQCDFRWCRRAWGAPQESSRVANQRGSQVRSARRELNLDN
jgi:hypothetical protein